MCLLDALFARWLFNEIKQKEQLMNATINNQDIQQIFPQMDEAIELYKTEKYKEAPVAYILKLKRLYTRIAHKGMIPQITVMSKREVKIPILENAFLQDLVDYLLTDSEPYFNKYFTEHQGGYEPINVTIPNNGKVRVPTSCTNEFIRILRKGGLETLIPILSLLHKYSIERKHKPGL